MFVPEVFAAMAQNASQLTAPQNPSVPAPGTSQNGNAAPSGSPHSSKLRQAAAEFEGMLISSLWKSMKSSFSEDEDDSTDPAHDTLNDLSIDTMSNAVAKAGGFGLGKLILKRLEPALAASQPEKLAPVSGKASTPSADYLCSGGSSDPPDLSR